MHTLKENPTQYEVQEFLRDIAPRFVVTTKENLQLREDFCKYLQNSLRACEGKLAEVKNQTGAENAVLISSLRSYRRELRDKKLYEVSDRLRGLMISSGLELDGDE